LMKILAGVYRPEHGSIHIAGETVQIQTRKQSQDLGVGMIFQELSVLSNLTVVENLFLAKEKKKGLVLDDDDMDSQAKVLIQSLGLSLSTDQLVEELSMGERQVIEIARAISGEAKIIVMDEPTSALTHEEQEKLFEIIRNLKARGTAIIYVSHRMDEIFAICDRITVLRDGKKIGTVDTKMTTVKQVITMMVGEHESLHEAPESKTRNKKSAVPVLEVNNLSGKKFKNVNFTLYKGEILGIAGLLGSGRTEILRALSGLDRLHTGTILVNGQLSRIHNVHDAISLGIIMVPEDRRNDGIIPGMSIRENVTLSNLSRFFPHGVISSRKEKSVVNQNIADLKIHPGDPEKSVGKLSGGNQQKVVISRCLNLNPGILLLDEPTQGIDIVAKTELYKYFRSLADQGMSIIIVSSELPELVSLSDRTIVLYDGQVKRILEDEEITNKTILYHATGGM
jgi:ribose transport system ATP-binding protein